MEARPFCDKLLCPDIQDVNWALRTHPARTSGPVGPAHTGQGREDATELTFDGTKIGGWQTDGRPVEDRQYVFRETAIGS